MQSLTEQTVVAWVSMAGVVVMAAFNWWGTWRDKQRESWIKDREIMRDAQMKDHEASATETDAKVKQLESQIVKLVAEVEELRLRCKTLEERELALHARYVGLLTATKGEPCETAIAPVPHSAASGPTPPGTTGTG